MDDGYIGQPIKRVEDPRLLTGAGRYTDDLNELGQAHGVFVRSPHARAEIVSIDAGSALAAQGVIAVLTGADDEAAGLKSFPCLSPIFGPDKPSPVGPHRPALARGEVRHVGECVALVVAETSAQAEDAAELVSVDYRELPAVADTAASVEPGAPTLWGDAPGNVYFEWQNGDADAADKAFAEAAHVVKRRVTHQRLVVNFLEPRAAIGSFDAETGRYTLATGSQGVIAMRGHLSMVLGEPVENIVVRTGDVGGGFGAKTQAFPEYVALLLAARKTGRPVKWCSTRSEHFVSDNHARDVITDAEMALDADGHVLALRVDAVSNLGAYLSANGAAIAVGNLWRCLASVYTTPVIAVRNRCVMTSTLPTGPYRGAGRPEANYLVERMMDAAAADTGMDRVTLRRRNLISPESMPYKTPVGMVYDSGDFDSVMEKALALAGYDGFEDRRRTAKARGLLAGVGISCFLESSGGFPREAADIRFIDGDTVEIRTGNQSNGQGHETVFPQLVADHLGLDIGRIRMFEGDSTEIASGGGSNASRSLVSGGTALRKVVDDSLEKGRVLAARHLEAAEDDIEYSHGAFRVAGTDREVDLWALNRMAAGSEDALDSFVDIPISPTFPNGCHIAEVEIDPDSGVARVTKYTALDDSGNIVNPMIVAGQVHGGIAQGLGQTLLENTVYEAETGQLLTGSLMDYCLPRADDMPEIATGHHTVPCTTNPLGAKGAGESGTTGSLAAIMNALDDALAPMGARAPDMPATPERLWQAIRSADR